MEVKPGYKQTDAGLLPADWDVGPIERAIERLDAGASVNSDKDETPDFTSYPCVLKTGASKEGLLDPTESKKVARRDLWRLKVALRKDTILISRMNTVELVGESGFVDADYQNLFVPDRMWMATLRAPVHPRWFSYVLAWQPVKARLSASATGTSGSMKNISKPSLRAVRIPYPLPEEQRAIATALSDVDGLLGGLDRLIAKKRDLKQAAMQQLLTGLTRLPGFHGEWEETTFGSVVRHHAGNSTLIKGKLPSSEATGRFPAYSASGQDVWCDHFEHEGDAIVVSAVGSRCGKAFKASGKWCAIANTHVVWPNPAKIDTRFLAYFINDEDFWQKSGTGQPFVLFTKTFARPLRLPPHPEQTAIASVLTEMDGELAVLEQRREKTRALKQAMMQELLTGRTRLL